jgi:hypothetical protein
LSVADRGCGADVAVVLDLGGCEGCDVGAGDGEAELVLAVEPLPESSAGGPVLRGAVSSAVVLIAEDGAGGRVEAARDLPVAQYWCPLCRADVIAKRGRVVTPHFAHNPGASCDAVGESARHMAAKALLAERFRELGYSVELEERHPEHARIVDVAVTVSTPTQVVRLAVEVQDSAIDVMEMKRREAADRSAGFFSTVWVFTSNRLSAALTALPGVEARLPNEIRYVWNARWLPLPVIHVPSGVLMLVSPSRVVRAGEDYYDSDAELQPGYDRTLRATMALDVDGATFAFIGADGRYGRRHAVFVPIIEVGADPWRIRVLQAGAEVELGPFQTPPRGEARLTALLSGLGGGAQLVLEHPPTRRSWLLVRKCRFVYGVTEEYWSWEGSGPT